MQMFQVDRGTLNCFLFQITDRTNFFGLINQKCDNLKKRMFFTFVEV